MRKAGKLRSQRLDMRPARKNNIQEHDADRAQYAHFLDDYGIDEIGEGLGEMVALIGLSGHLAHHAAGGDGDVGMTLLRLVFKYFPHVAVHHFELDGIFGLNSRRNGCFV